MDGGSCAGFDDNHDDTDVFEAGLAPLPTWDGASYSPKVSNNHDGGSNRRRHAATERQTRCEVVFLHAVAFRVQLPYK